MMMPVPPTTVALPGRMLRVVMPSRRASSNVVLTGSMPSDVLTNGTTATFSFGASMPREVAASTIPRHHDGRLQHLRAVGDRDIRAEGDDLAAPDEDDAVGDLRAGDRDDLARFDGEYVLRARRQMRAQRQSQDATSQTREAYSARYTTCPLTRTRSI